MTLLGDTAVAEPRVLAELKSVIILGLTIFQPKSEWFWIYFNISKLDLYTSSEHFVNIFINNLRQGSHSVLPKDGRYVT